MSLIKSNVDKTVAKDDAAEKYIVSLSQRAKQQYQCCGWPLCPRKKESDVVLRPVSSFRHAQEIRPKKEVGRRSCPQ